MKRLCQLLGVQQYIAVGILESLWHLTAKEAPQGDIGKLPDEDIALGLDWDGEPSKLIDSLTQARWLDKAKSARLIVHDWHLHCEDTIDVRLARNGQAYANGNLPRMNKLNKDERAHLCQKFGWVEYNGAFVRTKSHKKALPLPIPTPLPKPEPKPRPEPLPKTLARSVPPDELAGTLPLANGSDFQVSKSDVDRWAQAFPGVSVKQELKKFKAWCEDNPTRKKTAKGIKSAVFRWLDKAQNHGGGNGTGEQNKKRTEGNACTESGEDGPDLYAALYGPVEQGKLN